MHTAQLLVQIGVILALGRMLSRGFKRLGQPAVIAEIVAGIALGPSLLGWAWPSAMEALFPRDHSDELGLVAHVGLVFFMFLVGLEFDPRLLRGQFRASFAVSSAGIVVPFVLGAALALPLHGQLAPAGVPPLPFALFVGTALSVTAFPVLARILAEQRLIRTPIGALALASAAVGDVVAWCLLALVVGIASAEGPFSAVKTVGAVGVYAALVWGVVRPALARLGPRSGSGASTDVIAVVFLLVVASAALTELIGVHALFGSFLIGAAMPRRGGLSPVLVEKTEDFVTIVLLPVFFAYSGLRTQIGLVANFSDVYVTLLIIACASLGKLGGTYVVARWTGRTRREATALGVLMNTRGLMEIVVLNVGLDLGVIDERLFTMMVIMALSTTAVTAPVLRWMYPPETTLDGAPPAPIPSNEVVQTRGVMVCVSDPGAAAVLVRLAQACAGDEPVYALHLRPTERPQDYLRDPPTEEVTLSAATDAADALSAEMEAVSMPSASPAEDIVRVAEQRHVAMVLLGVHRSAFGQETLVRGVSGSVLRDCKAEVAVFVDRGLGEIARVRLQAEDGPHGVAARAVVERLVAGVGARQVIDGDADLVVVAWSPDLDPPPLGDRPWLVVRAAR